MIINKSVGKKSKSELDVLGRMPYSDIPPEELLEISLLRSKLRELAPDDLMCKSPVELRDMVSNLQNQLQLKDAVVKAYVDEKHSHVAKYTQDGKLTVLNEVSPDVATHIVRILENTEFLKGCSGIHSTPPITAAHKVNDIVLDIKLDKWVESSFIVPAHVVGDANVSVATRSTPAIKAVAKSIIDAIQNNVSFGSPGLRLLTAHADAVPPGTLPGAVRRDVICDSIAATICVSNHELDEFLVTISVLFGVGVGAQL